jgi:outer membrane lipopolysaccharide assembly protein LptE/RlpB
MQQHRLILSLSLLLAFTALVAGCKVVEDLLTFRLNNETTLVIPSAVGINTPFSVPTPEVTSNASQTFKSNNAETSQVKNIVLEKLTLNITSPSQANFQFLKSIKIYISAAGQPEKLLAYKTDIPTNAGTTLTLDTTGEAVDIYLKQEKYSLRTEAVTRQAVAYETTIKAQMTFRVTANI